MGFLLPTLLRGHTLLQAGRPPRPGYRVPRIPVHRRGGSRQVGVRPRGAFFANSNSKSGLRCKQCRGESGSVCFWGLLDPDPDSLVRGMDPEPDPSVIVFLTFYLRKIM